MSIPVLNVPGWAAGVTAVLLLLGSGLAFTGCLGLLRLSRFYDRMHAPTLGTTLGIGSVLIASMLFFSVLQARPVLHEILIAILMVVTTPITLTLLARAALYRDRSEDDPDVPPMIGKQRMHSLQEGEVFVQEEEQDRGQALLDE
ncbi:MAG TPA: monovalent cation/H(+) antiporter subunit G [Kiloniellales bacterium]|jgi:multicomponent K+:H+ antiporter subunit G|nr:monovalent cation/H(+) antiporter subunit G [Kiloniellales bacterium]